MPKTIRRIDLARTTTPALIFDSLKERILNHEFDEAEIIRQERLAKEYGVSLSPVREALIRLESDGLLTLHRHRGYVITKLSIDDIRQLYELRALVETTLLKHAIPKFQPGDFAKANKLHLALIDIFNSGKQTKGWTKINWDFHKALYEPAGKKQLLAVVDNAYANINLYIHMRLKLDRSVDLERNIQEHEALLGYCKAQEITKAAELLNKHIVQAADDLIMFLKEE